ncbi:PHP domain-containing protein [Metallumcola ferriviriculae]|uniref:PHP domain-containing protein n=1 Tax=Metallumcola ferriviriculae TaxID=3039180 RepID=A0AAU0UN55_9FIRM|nr:PHP domain-containing protein [Desulfitibacteraceae bacterium MK1]
MSVYEYTGNLHVHSTYSDGSGDIPEIAAAAGKAGIDFVGINDHHTLAGMKDGLEGWRDGVLILVGMENNHNNHHYLSYGASTEVPDNTDNPQKVIDAVNAQHGIGFIAHPFEKGSRMVFGGHAYTWDDWSVKGYTGISIWNYSSQWRDGATGLVQALYNLYLKPHRPITGPCSEALAKLDEVAQQRRITAIGGSDAHAVKIKYGPLSPCIFPYQFLFRTVNTHVLLDSPLTGDVEIDKVKIYRALAEGKCFVAFDFYKPTKGFRYWAVNGERLLSMGQAVDFSGGWEMKAELPDKGDISIIRNGHVVIQETGRSVKMLVEKPGAYRLAVRQRRGLGSLPWIYSNYLYFR